MSLNIIFSRFTFLKIHDFIFHSLCVSHFHYPSVGDIYAASVSLMNRAALSRCVQAMGGHSPCVYTESSVAGSYGHSSFTFLGSLHIDFHSACTACHVHSKHTRLLFTWLFTWYILSRICFLFCLFVYLP